jgi:putative endonuclease
MYYVYVIKSKIANFYYKGFCKNLSKRLSEHNSKMTKSNKAYAPFDIIYYEKCFSIEEAFKKEKYWKTAAGRRYLKNKMVPSFNG